MPTGYLLRAAAAPRALSDTGADTVRGIILVCLCFLIMTTGDVAAKWALPVAGLTGAMIGRGLFGGATVLGLAVLRGGEGWRRVLPVRWRLVLLRSLLHSAVSLTWYVAWETMTLADTYAVGFSAPLLMTLLAIPMLGERIRWRRALSTVVGFGGVLIMVRPGGGLWTPTVLVLLLGICGLAVSRNLTRLLSTTETPECLSFFLLATHLPVGLLLLTVLPAPGFAWDALIALAVLGLSNGVAHWLNSQAFALAPVSALAPYEYTPLLWGGMLGYLVFGEVPHTSSLIGAAVVAAAGLYNLHREQARRRAERVGRTEETTWPS
ncbi:DMT family transporter [Limobrevibacterium gyesilva]|uniref:DMT family transporter n=1 Tax=Limobrevibacterium gyesilva TaxID=2991712 RepID=A0AA42CIZ8_9PROT|nr:DMT family transporter [Limobrevibacterium gyesilva]MCW3476447.1 DMT family transporter [Limobrevibacterium gyesilva]